MLGITNIRIVSKYETKLLVRGWFFKVFAVLALLASLILGAIYILTQFPQPEIVNRSVIPYLFMLVMNVGQAVVSVFLASEPQARQATHRDETQRRPRLFPGLRQCGTNW